MHINYEAALSAVNSLPGTIGLYIEDTNTGEAIKINENAKVIAASVIKMYIMLEAFNQAEKGLINLNDEIKIDKSALMPSCGVLTYMHENIEVKIIDLITLMIIVSDNTACNVLIDLLGIENINAAINRHGFSHTELNRKLFDAELSSKGIENKITAGDCAKFMKALLNNTLLSKESNEKMLGILKNQRLNGKIPFYLHDKGIKSAHKTGEDDGITHDVGIIYGTSPIIFCFVSENTLVPQAELILQKLAYEAAV